MPKKTAAAAATPWERPAPKTPHKSKLTPAQKSHAKARAKKAGRSYPNLVDNMHEAGASGAGRKAATRNSAAKKQKKSTSRAAVGKRTTKTARKKTATKKTRAAKEA